MQKIENENYFGKQLKGTEYEDLSLFFRKTFTIFYFCLFFFISLSNECIFVESSLYTIKYNDLQNFKFFLLKRASMNL